MRTLDELKHELAKLGPGGALPVTNEEKRLLTMHFSIEAQRNAKPLVRSPFSHMFHGKAFPWAHLQDAA